MDNHNLLLWYMIAHGDVPVVPLAGPRLNLVAEIFGKARLFSR
jgi:hypothetical protein